MFSSQKSRDTFSGGGRLGPTLSCSGITQGGLCALYHVCSPWAPWLAVAWGSLARGPDSSLPVPWLQSASPSPPESVVDDERPGGLGSSGKPRAEDKDLPGPYVSREHARPGGLPGPRCKLGLLLVCLLHGDLHASPYLPLPAHTAVPAPCQMSPSFSQESDEDKSDYNLVVDEVSCVGVHLGPRGSGGQEIKVLIEVMSPKS